MSLSVSKGTWILKHVKRWSLLTYAIKMTILHLHIRDVRGNRIIQLSASTFDNFSASTTIYLQDNSLTCYPSGGPANIQAADIAKCVSLVFSLDRDDWSRLCTSEGNHYISSMGGIFVSQLIFASLAFHYISFQPFAWKQKYTTCVYQSTY